MRSLHLGQDNHPVRSPSVVSWREGNGVETRQIGQRGKSFHVVTGRNDFFWDLVSRGAWESETFEIFDRFIDRDKSYIDIGSWIGPTLLYGCQLAKAAYGIEPDPIAYPELAENIASNRPLTENVRLFNGCITRKTGKVSFGNRGEGGDSTSSLLFSQGETAWVVEGLSFEDFIRRNRIDDCTFIKIDIEGGEYSVLPTMVRYLRRHRPTVYLSLHPCFLGGQGDAGSLGKLKRDALRFANTLKMIRNLGFYKNLYDPRGNRLTPSQLLRTFHSELSSVVATDLEWGKT